MTTIATVTRAGQATVAPDVARTHILIILVDDRPGAVDRVVAGFRRRRANMQSLSLGDGGAQHVVRITVQVRDNDVSVEQLVEQVRKIVDVRQVTNLTPAQAVIREVALIKVAMTTDNFHAIIETAQQFGASAVDISAATVTIEVSGAEEKLTKCIAALQEYGIREIARSGSVAIARGVAE